MPYTVAVSFDRFYENINLPGDHRATANARRDDIVATLEKDFSILEAFHTGSIPRYTALKNFADLDVIVALHYGKHIDGKSPSEVLKDVRDSLAGYKTTVRRNGQAVTLYYKTWPHVDIVPASRQVNSDGEVTAYSIPDMHSETWLKSRPKTHSNTIRERSGLCGDSFRKIVKMGKWWNQKHSAFLQSYHIEAMAVETLTSSLTDMPWDVYCFFKSAAEAVKLPMWYNGGIVDGYLGFKGRSEAATRLALARDIARDAWLCTYRDDDHESAIRLWRKLFGDAFPAYGS